MAMYRGTKIPPYGWHVERNGSRLRPDLSLEIAKHSPDGFSWGYQGSGPAQLALALLLDVRVGRDRASALYQQFKRDVVATWNIDGEWNITTEEICQWVANNENGSRVEQS